MKRIEYILRKFGWPLRIGLFLLCTLWACQLAKPAKESMKNNAERYKNWSFEEEKTRVQELYSFRNKLYEQAREKNENYSPSMYFADLSSIESKKEELRIDENLAIHFPDTKVDFYQLASKNVFLGRFEWRDVEKAGEEFRQQDGRAYVEQYGLVYKMKSIQWNKSIHWVKTAYLRMIFIVLFLYLIRISERSGSTILETLLAEKKKFVLATIFWPVYFFKYPYNVAREIRVEAELRRLKGLFKVFTTREAGLVREVANSGFYKQWLAEFRQQNRGDFRRGLFLALMATLFIHLLFSSNLRASERRVRSPGLILCQIENQTNTEQNLTNDTNENTHQVEQWGVSPGIEFFELLLLLVIVRFPKNIWHSKEPDSIDRVPCSSLFGVFNFINQTMKGTRNEHDQEDNLLGCFTDWSNRSCICW